MKLQLIVHGEIDDLPVVAAARAEETSLATDARKGSGARSAAPARHPDVTGAFTPSADEDANATGAFAAEGESKPAARPPRKPAAGSVRAEDPDVTAVHSAAEDTGPTGAFAPTSEEKPASEPVISLLFHSREEGSVSLPLAWPLTLRATLQIIG